MAILQSKDNPGSRIDAGDRVLAAAKAVATRPIRAKLAAFAQAHAAYVAAEGAARQAEAKLREAEAAVGAADAEQDAALLALAAKMSGDGAPRLAPFKALAPLRVPAPSDLIALAVEKEVKLTEQIAKAAAKWKAAGAQTRAAAARLARAAAAVKAALARVPGAERPFTEARARRDALGIPWERAFAHLKNAARAAEDDGATGLFDALFAGPPRAPRKPRTPGTAKPAGAAPGAVATG